MTLPPKNVAIIGSGLGGTALAIDLAQRGISSTIYELRSEPGNIGGAVLLAPNALRILDRLGVYDHVREQGFNFTHLHFVTESGGYIGDYASGGKRYGYSALRIERSVLLKELHAEAGRKGVDIRFSKKAIGVEEDEGSATVKFEDGTSETADLVIGFDGIHSAIRPFVAGPNVEKRYSGFVGVGFAAPTSQIHFPSDVFQMPGFIYGQKGTFGMMPFTSNGDMVGCFSSCSVPKELSREGWAEFAKHEAIPWMREVHRDWPDPVQSMMTSLDPKLVSTWPLYELPELSTWHTKRVIIAGDAAHALSPAAGQGSAQAFEDAALLARTLSLSSPDFPLESALSRWEAQRRERVHFIGELSKRSEATRLPAASWLGQKVKEYSMWAAFWWKGETFAADTNDYDVEKVDLNL